jgi:hypothetical protein
VPVTSLHVTQSASAVDRPTCDGGGAGGTTLRKVVDGSGKLRGGISDHRRMLSGGGLD